MTTKNQQYMSDHAVEVPHDDSRLRSIEQRYSDMRAFWTPIYQEAQEDDRFVGGRQWADNVRSDRARDRRPIMTYNFFPSQIRQIVNQIRSDRPQIRVVPVEADRHGTTSIKNLKGTKDFSMSEIMMGMIRHIEHVSRADQAYDTATEHAVSHGIGAWQLNTRVCPTDPLRQELHVQRIRNTYSLYMDPNAEEADFSDAQDCFLISRITKKAFEAKYPGKQWGPFGTSADGGILGNLEKFNEDLGLVATYYWVEYEDDEVVRLSNGLTHYWSNLEPIYDEMKKKTGVHIAYDEEKKEVREHVLRPAVYWQQLNSLNFLTEPQPTVFERLPFYVVTGQEVIYDQNIHYESAIRHAKDAQQAYNYGRTAALEATSLAPKAPFIVASKQIDGRQRGQWDSVNKTNQPYLEYNPVDGVPPPQRVPPANPPVAELTNAAQDEQDIQAIVGIRDASLGAEGQEKSGKAILARQQQGSVSTYHYFANLARAMESMAREMVQAIPRVYDQEQVARLRLPDDSTDAVVLNETILDEKTGKAHKVWDLSFGKFDAVIDTGPSYATQRQEQLEAMFEFLGLVDEEARRPLLHLVAKEAGFAGADKVASILRKMTPDEFKSDEDRIADLPPGVEMTDDGDLVNEDGTPYEPEPSPEEQLAQKQAELAELEMQAKMLEAQAKMAKAQADMAEAQAKLQEVEQSKAESANEEEATQSPGEHLTQLEEVIQEAFRRHEENPRAHRVVLEEVIGDATVDLAERSRRYIDQRMGEMKGKVSREESGSNGATAPSVQLITNQEAPRPAKLSVETDDQGAIKAIVPEYSEKGT